MSENQRIRRSDRYKNIDASYVDQEEPTPDTESVPVDPVDYFLPPKKKKPKKVIFLICLSAVLLLCALLIGGYMISTSPGYIYARSKEKLESGDLSAALDGFSTIGNYEDAGLYTMYIRAIQYAEEEKYEFAIQSLNSLDGFLDSKFLSVYYQALHYDQQNLLEEAESTYLTVATFRDAPMRISNIRDRMLTRDYNEFLIYLTQFNPPRDKTLEAFVKLYDREYSDSATRLLDDLYNAADSALSQDCFVTAHLVFSYLADVSYMDSDLRIEDCFVAFASHYVREKQYAYAIEYLSLAPNHPKTADLLNECNYQLALTSIDSGKEDEGYQALKALGDYKDAQQLANEYAYQEALSLASNGKHAEAYIQLKSLGDYKSSAALTSQYEDNYNYGIHLQQENRWGEAIAVFSGLGNYADSADRLLFSWYEKAEVHMDNHEWEDASYAFLMAGNYLDAKERINEPIYLLIESLTPGYGLHYGEATGFKKHQDEKDIQSALISIYVPLLYYAAGSDHILDSFSFGYVNSTSGRANLCGSANKNQYIRLLGNDTLVRIDSSYSDPSWSRIFYSNGFAYIKTEYIQPLSIVDLFYFLHSEEYHTQNQDCLF